MGITKQLHYPHISPFYTEYLTEVLSFNRQIKNKDIEIERLEDKVQILELRVHNSSGSGSQLEESFDEQKQKKFNYQAHWKIEENLRERITDLKKELKSEKESNQKLIEERDSLESKLIQVKAEWANSELDNAKKQMSPNKSYESDS